jgi:glycine/D-amino acid oxidase-like deaminating enzyme
MPKALIIGQGIAGSVLALQMIERKWEVMVVNDPSLPSSSKHAAGLWNPVSFKRVTALNDIALYLSKLHAFYSRQEEILGAQFFHPISIARIFPTEDYKLLWEKKQDSDKMKPLLNTGENIISPWINPLGWGKVMGSGWLNVQEFLKATQNYLQSKNAYQEIHWNENDVENSSIGIRFQNIEYDYVVCCKGLSEKSKIWEAVRIIPNKGHLVEFESDQLNDQYVYHFGNFCLPLGNQKWRLGSTYEWDNADNNVDEQLVSNLINNLQEKCPIEVRVTKKYVGHRPTVHDRSSIIGTHPQFPKWAIFNGLGTKGVMNAPYIASLLIDNLENNVPIPKEYAVHRFFESYL